MKEYQKRVVDEKKELDIKIERLINFISGDVFKQLSISEQKMLKKQKNIMELYSDILDERIIYFKSN